MVETLTVAHDSLTRAPVIIEGVSVFLGIVAGAFIQYALDWIRTWIQRREQIKNVRFEANYVLSRVEVWRLLANDFRNAVNGDSPQNVVQYFEVSKVPLAASWAFVNSGQAFKVLGETGLRQLLDLLSTLTPQWENVINTAVRGVRENFNKPAAVLHANYLDAKLRDIETNAAAIKAITKR